MGYTHIANQFYDDSILSGTKTSDRSNGKTTSFYDDSILSGTKTDTIALV